MQTHLDSRAAFLVIIALVLFLSCASRDERLRIAAYKGDSEAASQLIAEGVEIDAKNEYGNTALMIAVIGGHLDISWHTHCTEQMGEPGFFLGRQDFYLRPLVFLMSASHFSPAWTPNRHGKVASLRCVFEYIKRNKVQHYCGEKS